jgi:ubiquinone/menaquinone biosynthesis C-methylase UbiE
MSEPANQDAVAHSFKLQASGFGDGRLTLARKDYLAWMIDFIRPGAGDAVLDVASGTGHLALALAEKAGRVHSLDLTAEMQAQAVLEAGKRSLRNVEFKLGNAEDLPYPAGAFDKATSRFAFHHFPDPGMALSEMARVVKADGSIFIIDMIAPEGEAGKSVNRYERLRDPSHAASLTHRQFTALIDGLGLRLDGFDTRRVEVETERWLDLTQTPAEPRARILADFSAELAGGAAATGMKPFRKEGVLHFEQNWNMYKILKGIRHT